MEAQIAASGRCALATLIAIGLIQTAFTPTNPGGLLEGSDDLPSAITQFPEVQWNYEFADKTLGVGLAPSLALDGNDDPHISYTNSDGDILLYAKRINGTWSSEIVDDTDLVGERSSIAVDSKGRVHIAYSPECPHLHPTAEGSHPGPRNVGLRYAVQNGNGWDLSVVDYGVWGAYPWLVLDKYDRPHISYGDWNHRGIHYAWKDGTSWHMKVVDPDASLYSALAVDSNGNPHVVYGKYVYAGRDLYYAKWNGTSWRTERLGQDGFVITRTAITMDESNRPHIVWGNLSANTSYATWNGTWTIENIPGSWGSGMSIVSFRDSIRVLTGGYSDYYGVMENGTWNWEIIRTSGYFYTDFYGGQYLAIDSEGIPHIAASLRTGFTAVLGYLTRAPQPFNAEAGPDQVVNEGEVVNLHGAGDAEAGGWSQRTNIPSPRAGGGSTAIEEEDEIYYVGGGSFDLIPEPSAVVQKYNTFVDTWSDFVDLPAKRAFLGAAWVGYRVYAIGGNDGNVTVNTTFGMDPRVAYWGQGAPMPIPMEAFGVAVVEYRIYVIGGTSTWLNCTYCGMVFEYDTLLNRWTRKADMPTPRKHLTTAVLNGKIYAIGGMTNSASSAVEVYDPVNDSWEKKADMPTARWGLSAQVLSGRIYALGGIKTWDLATDVNEMYNPSNDTWSSAPHMLDIRMDFGAGVVDNCIYVVGGYRGWMAGYPNSSEAYCLGGELNYTWDFDASVDTDCDGDYSNDQDAFGQDVSTEYGDDGIYLITMNVRDGSGKVGSDTLKVTVNNVAPTASDVVMPSGFEGQVLTFRAVGIDPGSDDLTFIWHWDDGTADSSTTYYNDGVGPDPHQSPWGTHPFSASDEVEHTYGDDGVFHVSLELKDDDRGVAFYNSSVIISNVLPAGGLAILSVQQNEGDSIQFSAHITDPGSDDILLDWAWGDGAPGESSIYYVNGISPDPYPSPDFNPRNITDVKSHTYGDNGAFTVTVFVRDDDSGDQGITIQITATPGNLPPSVSVLGSLSIDEGQSLILNATATDPGSDDLSFTWTWGEGSSESRTHFNDAVGPDPPQSPDGTFPFAASDIAEHTYGDNGQYIVTLMVTDDDGGSTSWSGQLAVANLPPIIGPFGPFNVKEGDPLSILADVTDPGSDDLTFVWAFDYGTVIQHTFYNDGAMPDPQQSPQGTFPFTVEDRATHTYGDNGFFNISLTVTDDDGGMASYRTEVTVENVPPIVLDVRAFMVAEITLRIAGEKWHDVTVRLYDEGNEVGASRLVRYPGSPNDQTTTISDIEVRLDKPFTALMQYTPDDDPVNGQPNGADPAWLFIRWENGKETRLQHTFNVQQKETWNWTVDDFQLYGVGQNIHLKGTAYDPGSDDLTFTWDSGDGRTVTSVYFNNGLSPDPHPSPEVNPMIATSEVEFVYVAGVYRITLFIHDDDQGSVACSFEIRIG
jgi:hypothetical protein